MKLLTPTFLAFVTTIVVADPDTFSPCGTANGVVPQLPGNPNFDDWCQINAQCSTGDLECKGYVKAGTNAGGKENNNFYQCGTCCAENECGGAIVASYGCPDGNTCSNTPSKDNEGCFKCSKGKGPNKFLR